MRFREKILHTCNVLLIHLKGKYIMDKDKQMLPVDFSFFKGDIDIFAEKKGQDNISCDQATAETQKQLEAAIDASNISFLFGSGCSSYIDDSNKQLGINTMGPMAQDFFKEISEDFNSDNSSTSKELKLLNKHLGIDIKSEKYKKNLERLMEVLFSAKFTLADTKDENLHQLKNAVDKLINKIKNYVVQCCRIYTEENETVIKIYQTFYQKLLFRNRSLPRPWIFTTNYDIFNEIAMDRLGISYCNGFSGVIERRFNPSVYRYSLAEQLDISIRKWVAVDNFVYLCKLHGSINWFEDEQTLFPIREIQEAVSDEKKSILIYPTPTKQNASLGSPYVDLFREFQKQIVREQSVLFVIGYSFGDEHINNIIFQALTIPNFRLIVFISSVSDGIPKKLMELKDPRIWIITNHDSDKEDTTENTTHYFKTFIDKFMPESPDNKIDSAIENVQKKFI